MTAPMCLSIALLVACASRAENADRPPDREQKSKEYETCGATTHCQDALRCVDHVCRREARSILGDYQVTFGAAARARGDLAAAIDAYEQAVSHYEAEKVPVPPDIECTYGGALVAGRDLNSDFSERAARVLHRCLLAVPPSSDLRERALADLVTLSEMGFDYVKLADRKAVPPYITKPPQKPPTDTLAITAVGSPAVPPKSAAKLTEKLASPDFRKAFLACWDKYYAATRKRELVVQMGLKLSYVSSEYEDVPDTYAAKIDVYTTSPQDVCVHAAIAPVIKAVKWSETFTTTLSVTIK